MSIISFEWNISIMMRPGNSISVKFVWVLGVKAKQRSEVKAESVNFPWAKRRFRGVRNRLVMQRSLRTQVKSANRPHPEKEISVRG